MNNDFIRLLLCAITGVSIAFVVVRVMRIRDGRTMNRKGGAL